MSAAASLGLEIDLEVFQGPFDLLLTLVLREEVDLLEVELADVVLAYIDHLDRAGELDLESATEFLVLIAALLELKSRLMLPGEEGDELELEPGEAADELLARMLEYSRYKSAAAFLVERLGAESGFRYRSAPLPPDLRRISVDLAEPVYDPARLGEAIGSLLRHPPQLDLGHVARPHVSLEARLSAASPSTMPWRERIGSRKPSRSSRCWSSTRRARPSGSRERLSVPSPCARGARFERAGESRGGAALSVL